MISSAGDCAAWLPQTMETPLKTAPATYDRRSTANSIDRRHAPKRTLRAWARLYYGLGFIPVPTIRTRKCKGQPLVAWEQSGWKDLALQGEQPPWADVQRVFQDAAKADGIALIQRRGLIVIDTDGPAGEQFVVEHGYPDCPQQSGARGVHYWFALPDGLIYEGTREIAPEMDAIGAGSLIYVEPSPDKKWDISLQDTKPPLAPDWALTLIRASEKPKCKRPAKTAKSQPANIEPITEEEIAPYLELVPDLRRRGPYKCVGTCPLHADQKPSFVVCRAARDGRVHWIDFGACRATLVRRRRLTTGAMKEYHGGTLRELQRLLLRGRGLDVYDRLHQAINALDVGCPVRRLLMAALAKARDCRLDPLEQINFSYREIAQATGCEKVVMCNPDGRWRRHLSNNGRDVQRLLAELQTETGVAVEIGQSGPIGGGRRNTKLLMPRAWVEPYCATKRTAERDLQVVPSGLAQSPESP